VPSAVIHRKRQHSGVLVHGYIPAELLAVAASQFLVASPVLGQSDRSGAPDFLNEDGPRARLMLLEAFHFSYPDRDVRAPWSERPPAGTR
jgi:hypothetical protein